MSQALKKDSGPKGRGRKRLSIILFVLSGILLIAAACGYWLQGTEQTRTGLNAMRTQAVLHTASDGLLDAIASQARSEKLKELRARKDFRTLGLDEVNNTCDTAAAEARAAAEALYSNPRVADSAGLEGAIVSLETALSDHGTLRATEREAYSEIYVSLIENVPDWTDLTDAAGDDDSALFASLSAWAEDLASPEAAHLQPGLVRLARDMAGKERAKEDEELLTQLTSAMTGAVSDWSEYAGLEDDGLWAALSEQVDGLSENERFRDQLLKAAKERISAAEAGETVAEAVADEGADTVYDTVTDYSYFTATEALNTASDNAETAFEGLWSELTEIIPDLSGLDNKMRNAIRTTLENTVWAGSDDFTARYNAYTARQGGSALSGSAALAMRLAASAQNILIAGIALALLAALLMFWTGLTGSFGVPRTIITLFFIYLCLAAVFYHISVPMMLSNVLIRMGMYGILVLAMMPGIQCGIGLNMGMTIGCIAGLLGIVLSLQFDMTGWGGLLFACASGAVVALPLGWAYSKLLNRMKGSEMTISTYVGFSFVALMCIGWMMLPFNNPKIIWLLSGHGLRVTHSLLGSYAHLLDNFLSFEILGVKVPTGLLLFLLLGCLLMWLFSRSRTGIAMTAVGSNPRFAEASGISVNRMRTIGTVLSTVIAAVGIVIYSQAFGYAQLYTAPRQLGFIASSAILIGGATVRKAKVSHVLFGVFLFEGVLVLGQQIANSAVAGGGLSEVMRIMISNGIILYALTQTGGGSRE